MAKYIAHNSGDENRRIKGGKAGDQTGKECCIRTWYNKPWDHVIRIMDEAVRIQFANNMIDIANNNNVGYDQNQRNTLLTQAKKVDFDFTKIKTKCEADCSSTVTTALLGAIYTVLGVEAYEKAYAVLVVDGNCARTATLKKCMLKLTVVSVKVYTASAYIKGTSKAVYGDIYNKEHGHVVCYIDNGKKRSNTATPSKKKTVEEVAKEVLAGKWGNGEARKAALEKAGYDPEAVQEKVNHLAKGTSAKKSVTEIAKEIIDGKWGNGADRKKKLEAAGYDPEAVQKKVNALMK